MKRICAFRRTANALLAVGICAAASFAPAVAAEQSKQPAGASLRRVILAFKTHFDIGYTDLAANVIARYRTTMIDQALAVVDANRSLPPEYRFVWTLPGWPLSKIVEDWSGQSPERKARVLEAFRQGRFVVHALPFTTHTETLDLEDLVRGLGFASRLCRQAGLPLPRDAKMTDVPCHSWILPTLLKHAGVDFLHLGCNSASSSPRVPMLFWWEGPDGSRLLTMYSASGYGTGLLPPAGWPYRTWLALIHTGDNHGPPRRPAWNAISSTPPPWMPISASSPPASSARIGSTAHPGLTPGALGRWCCAPPVPPPQVAGLYVATACSPTALRHPIAILRANPAPVQGASGIGSGRRPHPAVPAVAGMPGQWAHRRGPAWRVFPPRRGRLRPWPAPAAGPGRGRICTGHSTNSKRWLFRFLVRTPHTPKPHR